MLWIWCSVASNHKVPSSQVEKLHTNLSHHFFVYNLKLSSCYYKKDQHFLVIHIS